MFKPQQSRGGWVFGIGPSKSFSEHVFFAGKNGILNNYVVVYFLRQIFPAFFFFILFFFDESKIN